MKNKYTAVFFFLVFSVIAGLSLGTEFYTPHRLFCLSDIDRTIVLNIRAPRVMAAFIIGAGLSITGAVLQALLKNPLAESYTLGISGGASLGIAIGVIIGKTALTPYFAFLGAMLCLFIVLLSSIKKHLSNPTVILLGVALNFLFSSFVLFIIAVARNQQFQATMLRLIGDISYFPSNLLYGCLITITLTSLFLILSGRVYDVISIGDEKAISIGINIEREKRTSLILCCVITGLCVSLGGIIGFVGLVIPHITRFFFGPSHKRALTVNFITGGSFLILADTLARIIIRPLEIPVGVITGLIGGLFFLSILLRGRYMWG
ncbi:MAG: iron ABC transporter permease [Candidatus Ratteibacteria bacterium]|nr:iron ABC transporter permease [Candidatus Ratteibacteria bacterium]